jgi:dolichol-phosphate mannosyltransferase
VTFSVVIPALNEFESVGLTVDAVIAELDREAIDYEILVVEDASTDDTGDVVRAIAQRNDRVRCIRSSNPPGFGHAVRAGLDCYTCDAVAVMMADLSDSPRDLVEDVRILERGYDRAFRDTVRLGRSRVVIATPACRPFHANAVAERSLLAVAS